MPCPFERLFSEYGLAFDAFDAEAVALFYHCPCLMVNGEVTIALTSEGMILNNMRALIEQHRSQRVGHASASVLRAENRAENLASVQVDWQIFAIDETLLWKFANTYDLADYGDGWKILASTTHAAENQGQAE